MSIAETESGKTKLLDMISTAVTIIGEGQSAGPFESEEEMKNAFAEMNVVGPDTVGEKP